MARPRSEDKRAAILAAATRVIVAQGLGAPTVTIAREAGVANGSLFTYFPTKANLFNDLYLELKTGMATATLAGLPAGVGVREQLSHLWSNWVRWAASNPDQQRALAQLGVCDAVTPHTRAAAHQTLVTVAGVLERSRATGPMRHAPMRFVVAVMTALAEATIACMAQDPANADQLCDDGFAALWRAIA